jgi:hypothetical protein
MQMHLHEVKILQIHNAKPEFVKNITAINQPESSIRMYTRCLIQDVVSPHCGDKRMAQHCTRRSLPNYFDMTSYHWNVRQNTAT